MAASAPPPRRSLPPSLPPARRTWSTDNGLSWRERIQVPPNFTTIVPDEAAIATRYADPPRFMTVRLTPAQARAHWAEVTPAKRILAYNTQWLIDRFGGGSDIVRDTWSLLPFMREPPHWNPLPEGWSKRHDSMGRRYYKNTVTGATTWSRPRQPVWEEPVTATATAVSPEPAPERTEPLRRSARLASRAGRR